MSSIKKYNINGIEISTDLDKGSVQTDMLADSVITPGKLNDDAKIPYNHIEEKDSRYAFSIVDSENNLVFGLKPNGKTVDCFGFTNAISTYDSINSDISSIQNNLKSITNPIIPCWGDSLTAAGCFEKEIQSQVGSNYTVYNCGVGGENSLMICAREGALAMYLENDVVLPYDGSAVKIGDINDSGIAMLNTLGAEVKTTLLRQGEGKATINPCYIQDHKCKLLWTGSAWNDSNGTYTLALLDTGLTENITLKAKTPIFTNGMMQYRNPYAAVFWIGQNGGWDTTDSTTITNTLVEQYKRMIEVCGTSNYVIVGLHSGTESSRSVLESVMLKEFGIHYINWRKYCVERALADASISPTVDDISAIAQGSCPPSLRIDGVHHNVIGYQLLGKQIMNRFRYMGVFKNETK